MKKLIVLLILVGFISCKKEKNNDDENYTPGLVSSWDWQRTVTGWGAVSLPNPDSLITLSLNTNGSYDLQLNSVITQSGVYTVSPDSITNNYDVIHFDQPVNMGTYFRLQQRESILMLGSDSLLLYDYLVADGCTHLFIRHHL